MDRQTDRQEEHLEKAHSMQTGKKPAVFSEGGEKSDETGRAGYTLEDNLQLAERKKGKNSFSRLAVGGRFFSRLNFPVTMYYTGSNLYISLFLASFVTSTAFYVYLTAAAWPIVAVASFGKHFC